MSISSRSIACEERRVTEEELVDLLPMQHLSISNASIDTQPFIQVVQVSGNITISF